MGWYDKGSTFYGGDPRIVPVSFYVLFIYCFIFEYQKKNVFRVSIGKYLILDVGKIEKS
jgi:hypothetical protein